MLTILADMILDLVCVNSCFFFLIFFSGKAKIQKMTHDLRVKHELLESAMNVVIQN